MENFIFSAVLVLDVFWTHFLRSIFVLRKEIFQKQSKIFCNTFVYKNKTLQNSSKKLSVLDFESSSPTKFLTESQALREKCPNTEFFCSVFSRILRSVRTRKTPICTIFRQWGIFRCGTVFCNLWLYLLFICEKQPIIMMLLSNCLIFSIFGFIHLKRLINGKQYDCIN